MGGDVPRSSDEADGGFVQPGAARPPRAPRWVKVSAVLVAVVVLLLLAVLKLTGAGGEHGPGRHTGAAGAQAGAVVEHIGSKGLVNGTSLWR